MGSNVQKDEPTLRKDILKFQLRKRMWNLAGLQRQIPYDIDVYLRGGPLARADFVNARKRYLDILNISTKQLREAMVSLELVGTEYDDVEDIVGTVPPKDATPKLTREELEPHVKSGRIEEAEIDCIISAEFPTLEEYEDYLNNDIGYFGTHAGTYDGDGVYVEHGEDEPSDPLPDSDSTKPVVKLPPLEPASFSSWADEVEEMEASKTQANSDNQQSNHQTPNLDQASNIDQEPKRVDHDVCSEQPEPTSNPSPTEDNLDKNANLEIEDSVPESDHTDAVDQIEMLSNVMKHVDLYTGSDDKEDSSEDDEGLLKNEYDDKDELLDTWVEEQGKWYWQLELVFAAYLTKQRLKEQFKSARHTYIIDTWNTQH
ncbi:hypothetical protein F5B20DRAFT_586906 [Whalleya microplaca]|nr:hypothetical protein F5B20DRAFT_586906 [Whalleya microplaca]